MVIEAASISYPGVLEVATIVQTASRLVKLRFNTGKNEIWMDCESPDLYPGKYQLNYTILHSQIILTILTFKSRMGRVYWI